MSLTRLALRFAAPPPRLEGFGRYLFVGPHPDDIEIGAGATAAALCAMGKTVCFLICTDGRYGDEHTGLRGDALAQARRQEAIASARMLGVADVRFLGLSDGGFYSEEALVRGIAGVIGDFRPDVIFAPDPCVSSEGHTDHLRCGQAVRRLAVAAPNAGIMEAMGACAAPVQAAAFYMTAKPNSYVSSGKYLARQKEAVFSCHRTQFPPGGAQEKSIRLYLTLRAVDFGLRSLKGRAEGFRVLSQTQMHCLPESGR